jgi:flagellar FliJ protein
MKSTKRLKPILGIAIRQQEKKEAELASTLRMKNQAEQQLLQLKTYRSEYHSNLANGHSINISQLINQQRFISQLDLAISAQNEKTSNIDSLASKHRQDWHHAKNKRDALENLLEKRLEALRRKIEKADQLEQDNRTIRQGYRIHA